MSAPEARGEAPVRLARASAAPDGGPYGTIVVVGGGCYGSWYVRQLLRARERGAISWTRLLVVDRDAGCQAAREGLALALPDERAAAPALVVAGWTEFFARFLARAASEPSKERDAIVPSPLMPHLMFDWLLARARERWPGRTVERRALAAAPATPWERAGTDGTHYVSFATWMCPINCVEPATCPHTRGARDWSMPEALAAYGAAERAAGRPVEGPVVFHCAHRAYGVGMFDVAAVVAADALVRDVADGRGADVLVGTASHCHGAVALLSVGDPLGPGARQ